MLDSLVLKAETVVHPGRLHRDLRVAGMLGAQLEEQRARLLQLALFAQRNRAREPVVLCRAHGEIMPNRR